MSTWSECVSSDAVQIFSYPHADDAQGCSDRSFTTDKEMQFDMIEAARMEGIREGEARAQKQFENSLRAERAAILQAIHRLDAEREAYARRAEPEVVRLALAIAKKVLHRESQIDPMMLAGIVRSALDRLKATGKVVLRVTPRYLEQWRKAVDDISTRADVLADPDVPEESCTLETELGNTEISISGPLLEIEKGFFDLLNLHGNTEQRVQ
jgi:flagellar assembly protein FliH